MNGKRRPIGLWIAAIFAGLVAVSLLGNVVGWLLGQQSATESLIRPQALLTISFVGGVLHVLWFRAAWRKSVKAPLFGTVCLAFLALIAVVFWTAPGMFLTEQNLESIQFRPHKFAVWAAVYGALIAITHFYKRRGYLQ